MNDRASTGSTYPSITHSVTAEDEGGERRGHVEHPVRCEFGKEIVLEITGA